MTNATGPTPLDDATREAILQTEVAKAVRQGYSVQSVGAGQAVLTKTKRIGFFWNLILTLVTVGIWLIWIIYRALNRKRSTLIITVDAFGKVRRS